MTRLVVLAWGNPSRGDDALGPEFLQRAQAAWVGRGGEGIDAGGDLDIAWVTDFQLQPEHALDLDGRDLALFVDASTVAAAPFEFMPVAPARDRTFSSHAMSPAAVLAAYEQSFGAPPPAFVLAIRGERFELGDPLGVAAQAHLSAALDFTAHLLVESTAVAWRQRATRTEDWQGARRLT